MSNKLPDLDAGRPSGAHPCLPPYPTANCPEETALARSGLDSRQRNVIISAAMASEAVRTYTDATCPNCRGDSGVPFLDGQVGQRWDCHQCGTALVLRVARGSDDEDDDGQSYAVFWLERRAAGLLARLANWWRVTAAY